MLGSDGDPLLYFCNLRSSCLTR
uniref:Uncharacterized protein n=1 Tax=Anguilla anguilla TaxID=7936 RepID=A0A0E9U8T2_ANGAN